MYQITVITPTIGRKSLYKTIESLSKSSNVKILHFILWDNKRCDDGIEPDDKIMETYNNENYKIHNYIFPQQVYNIARKDNYLRNIGIIMATTEYITMLGDDCWIENDWYSRAINNIQKEKNATYTFCKRYIWKNKDNNQIEKLGIDDYESIGITNKFGYKLIENDALVFTKNIKFIIAIIIDATNSYISDRMIAQELTTKHIGIFDIKCGLNQICPDNLVNFHSNNITKF